MNTKTIALGLSGLTLLAGLSFAQRTHAGDGRNGTQAGRGRMERIERHRNRRLDLREERREFVRGLEFTEAQRELLRQSAAEIAPRARELRAEGRQILERARERARAGDRAGARDEAREALRELRQRAGREFAPHGRAALDALTPEQRARIEARLAQRGRTLDPERAAERIGRRLARPRAEERLERGPAPRTR